MQKEVFSPNMSINSKEIDFLASLIYRLVENLKIGNEHLYKQLVLITQNQVCCIQVDHVKITMETLGTKKYSLKVSGAKENDRPIFITKGDIIRNIINGNYTLDYAMLKGLINVYGTIEDLIRIHNLFIGILSEGAVFPALRELWDEFDRNWISSETDPIVSEIETQIVYNYNIFRNTDKDVLNAKIE